MRKVLLLVLLLSIPVWAQQAADSIRALDLQAHLYFLAADEMAGRDSVSAEGRITANYIAAHFMRLGLKPVGDNGTYFQNFNMVRAWLDEENTTLKARAGGVEKTYQLGHDFQYTRQSNTPTNITAPLVFLGYGINAPEYGYNDFAGADVRGKVAMVLTHEPQESDTNSKFKGKWHTIHAYNWYKIEQIRKAGAAGILIVQERPHRPQRVPSAPTNAQAGPTPQYALAGSFWDVPVFTITQDVADELLRGSNKTVAQLQDQIDRSLQPQSFDLAGVTISVRKSFKDSKLISTRNVLGLLEGSDPQVKDEVIVITGHYDHVGIVSGRIYRGADDNASGTAAVMEIAEAYRSANLRPKRSLLFLIFEAEERGLLGAFHYVDHPVIPMSKTVANLNMDMIGRDEHSATWNTTAPENTNGVNVVGTLYNPELRRIIEASNRNINLKLDYKTDADDREGWFSRSDHYPFALKSVPMVLFNTGEHPDYHTEHDSWDRINYAKMEKITRLVFLTSLELANGGLKPRFTSN